MPDIPALALAAAESAIRDELKSGREVEPDRLARAALEAAAPLLADKIASAILRYADQYQPPRDRDTYLAWHRHFDAASAIAAKVFGRDNLEAPR